jgi:hypothetical protein
MMAKKRAEGRDLLLLRGRREQTKSSKNKESKSQTKKRENKEDDERTEMNQSITVYGSRGGGNTHKIAKKRDAEQHDLLQQQRQRRE